MARSYGGAGQLERVGDGPLTYVNATIAANVY
jgi:hypothetical protein